MNFKYIVLQKLIQILKNDLLNNLPAAKKCKLFLFKKKKRDVLIKKMDKYFFIVLFFFYLFVVSFFCLSKSVFSSFKFPLCMNFFKGTFLNFFLKPYSMSEFAGFKNTDMSICKNLHKIPLVPLNGREEGSRP